jgi:hypothetical protein
MAGWHHGEWPLQAATPSVSAVTVIKPDRGDGPNLARTTYRAAGIGAPKPDALARQVHVIDPAVVVNRHPPALCTTGMPWALARVSLVVTTDDIAEQAVLAHRAHVVGVPLVACAMYKKAALGEAALAVPAAGTACWWSAVGAVTPAGSYGLGRDYSLGGCVAGETAPGVPVRLTASVAAFGLLAGPNCRPRGPPRRCWVSGAPWSRSPPAPGGV